jgi:S-adenosylmethionine:tRNA ribosyltransferase-isomerase
MPERPDEPLHDAPGPRVADFDYDLPPEQIAQAPARPRDASRLMRLDRASGAVSHHRFHDLPDLLRPDDLLVLNDTRVVPAALTARRETGGRIEGCFLRARDDGAWEVLLSGRGRLREGETLAVVDADGRPHASIRLEARGEGGVWTVRPTDPVDAFALLESAGRPPLPPYIRRERDDPRTAADRADYQTVYARQAGAVAAPTAGLHFTDHVFRDLEARGIRRTTVTLHVGLGTFQPVRAERAADHRMHAEWRDVSADAAAAVNRARAAGRRVVAVGTTTVRTLESAAAEDGTVQPGRAWTDLFIYPPYTFRAVGAMVTNFHLPRTTLLMMVSAFAGREHVLAAYREAVRDGYRFYSYGDAMLIG